MAKKISETISFELSLTKSLVEQLELLALTGMYGAERRDVIEHILSAEMRRLHASGEFSSLRNRINQYPAMAGNDGAKKESKAHPVRQHSVNWRERKS